VGAGAGAATGAAGAAGDPTVSVGAPVTATGEVGRGAEGVLDAAGVEGAPVGLAAGAGAGTDASARALEAGVWARAVLVTAAEPTKPAKPAQRAQREASVGKNLDGRTLTNMRNMRRSGL
jgi:hypothetical protein